MTDWTEKESSESTTWTEKGKNPPKARPAGGDWSIPNLDDPYLFTDYDFTPYTKKESAKGTSWQEKK